MEAGRTMKGRGGNPEGLASQLCTARPAPVLPLALALAALLGFEAPVRAACGVSWTQPYNTFDSVNERGHVSLWETVGKIDLGRGLVLPIIINFRSSRETISPYLGYGWMLALLESHMYQTEDNQFTMVQPDGWNRYFWRGKVEDTVLDGQGGWKAEIKGDTITAWAPCGWRLEFKKGKISSMESPDSRKFAYVYRGSFAVQITEQGAPILAVEPDKNGTPTALSWDSGRQNLAFTLTTRPRARVHNGRLLVEGLLPALGGFANDPVWLKYEVPSAAEAKLSSIEGQTNIHRTLVWSPETKRAIAVSGSHFEHLDAYKGLAGYGVRKIGTNGVSEVLFQSANGLASITSFKGEPLQKKETIPAGPAAGRIRSIQEWRDGKWTPVVSYAYDNAGRPFRETYPDGRVAEYVYSESPKMEQRWAGGELQMEKQWSADGRALVHHFYRGSHNKWFLYRPPGGWPTEVQRLFSEFGEFLPDADRIVIDVLSGTTQEAYAFLQGRKVLAYTDGGSRLFRPGVKEPRAIEPALASLNAAALAALQITTKGNN